MSAALLDVNVLIALLDPDHLNHADAHRWFGSGDRERWATCPLTINGCVRILSGSGYLSQPFPSSEAASLLRERCAHGDHESWPADISLLDESRFHLSKLSGSKQLTDVYLLALAVAHRGKLVTFDRSIPWRAVVGAAPASLKILGG
jgi:uncharacterized protein